jgi:hypothetical protein
MADQQQAGAMVIEPASASAVINAPRSAHQVPRWVRLAPARAPLPARRGPERSAAFARLTGGPVVAQPLMQPIGKGAHHILDTGRSERIPQAPSSSPGRASNRLSARLPAIGASWRQAQRWGAGPPAPVRADHTRPPPAPAARPAEDPPASRSAASCPRPMRRAAAPCFPVERSGHIASGGFSGKAGGFIGRVSPLNSARCRCARIRSCPRMSV